MGKNCTYYMLNNTLSTEHLIVEPKLNTELII